MTRPTRHLAFRVVTALILAGPAAAQAPPPNASFVLHNQGAAAFREVYVSASSDPNWGPDRTREVSGPPLIPGRTMVVLLPGGQCINDIRVIYANGRPWEQRQVNTCATRNVAAQ
ncbi:hypothetical protein [Falsiroseomonas sp.]|uniref:hypothetical protein n=1 Tax=Falsiroseomonas sp. TaxID=2870721 RepID=UPI00356B341E